MLNYNKFLNETNMTSEKEGDDLELNDRGKKLPPFKYYYSPEMNNKNYFVLKSITFNDYEPQNNRVTLLKLSLWEDTEIRNRRNKILDDTTFNQNDFYFYRLVSTNRRSRESTGVSIPYTPDRFNNQLTIDNKLHFIIIRKNENIPNVRLNSGQRSSVGYNAEKIISDKFGWELVRTKISKKILGSDYDANGIIDNTQKRAIFSDILKTDIGVLNRYADLFTLEDPGMELNKYDLIIKDEKKDSISKKIEVKKYNSKYLISKPKEDEETEDKEDKETKVKKILMSEQLKISTKSGLKKLVDLYKEMNPDVNVYPLLNTYRIDKGVELNNFFRKDNNGGYDELIQNIRNFYNERIDYMFEKYNEIDDDLIMKKIYGVYFFNNDNGVDGFLIKTENEFDTKIKYNLKYTWEKVESHWGLLRIKLMVEVNPNATRMVWLGNEKLFIRTFKLNNFKLTNKLKEEDEKTNHNPIIVNTDIGSIKWSSSDGYWVLLSQDEAIDGVGGLVLENPSTP